MNISLQEDCKSHSITQIQQRAFEDRFKCFTLSTPKLSLRFYTIFDGHGGAMCMGEKHIGNYCVDNLHDRLVENLLCKYSGDVNVNIQTIINTFVYFDLEMHKLYMKSELLYGTTCTMIMIDVKKKKIYQINLGDSRSIIFTDNNIISETKDHNPINDIEKDRIIKSGYSISDNRIGGDLAVSRSFGDYKFKRIVSSDGQPFFDPVNGSVSCVPEIKVLDIIDNMHIILTSDAPFERSIMNSQSLVDMFNKYYPKYNIQDIAFLMAYNISENSTDDTTIIIVTV